MKKNYFDKHAYYTYFLAIDAGLDRLVSLYKDIWSVAEKLDEVNYNTPIIHEGKFTINPCQQYNSTIGAKPEEHYLVYFDLKTYTDNRKARFISECLKIADKYNKQLFFTNEYVGFGTIKGNKD